MTSHPNPSLSALPSTQPSSSPLDSTYHPHDTISTTIRTTSIMTGIGTLVASVQNTTTRAPNTGGFAIFSKFGGTIALWASLGASYEFTRCASANLREKEDTWNSVWGGFVAGCVGGLRRRTFPAVLGAGALLAIVQGAYDYSGGLGGAFSTVWRDTSVDEYARKQALRENKRRPMEETLEQLGEGRGIQGPGYEERRAERIKQRYGIEVPKYDY